MSESTVREGSFSVTTRIKASPEALYKAWTEQADMEKWLATSAEADARVKGKYILKWPSPDGDLSARGEYVELVPGRKIVQTWESWGPEGRFEGGDAVVQVDFKDLGDGTTEMTQTEWSSAYHGHFVSLVPNSSVVEALEFETTNPAMSGKMTITYTLAPSADGTELSAVHEGIPEGVSPSDNELGWRMSLDKLAALAEAPDQA